MRVDGSGGDSWCWVNGDLLTLMGMSEKWYSPSFPVSLLSSTKFFCALKSMLPLLGQTVSSDHGQCKECQSPCPDGPLGHSDLIMRMVKVVFHPLERKGLLVH